MSLKQFIKLRESIETEPGTILGLTLDGMPTHLSTITKETQNGPWLANLDISGLELTSLKYCPKEVKWSFRCRDNNLTSLEHGPEHVGGIYECTGNKLVNLIGAPRKVIRSFVAQQNPLTSLEGAPVFVGGSVALDDYKFDNLSGIHKHFKHINGTLELGAGDVKHSILGLLLIKGLTDVIISKSRSSRSLIKAMAIINKHLPSKGMETVSDVQDLMIEAGLDDFAEL